MIELGEYKKQFEASFAGESEREHALAKAISFGLPHSRMENWKYTDLKPMHDICYAPSTSNTKLNNENLPAKTTGWPRLVFLNGQVVKKLSDPHALDLVSTSKASINVDYKNPDQVFECLNIALNNGGFELTVPNGVNIDGLEVLFLFDGNQKQATHIRNTIHVEKGANLSILLNYSDQFGQLGWVDVSNDITVESAASLVHYSDISAPNSRFLNVRDAIALNGGSYENHSLLMSCASARHEVEFFTKVEGSKAIINGAFLGGEGETLDTLTRANHLVPNCTSEQYFKGVVATGGKTAFQGKVIVEKDAQLTVANQSCKNIILDRSAEANIKPELLIYADDVKCAHGTTVGELDEKALFYLEQRGITPKEAKTILINAFLEEILDNMPSQNIQACFSDKIAQWMSAKN